MGLEVFNWCAEGVVALSTGFVVDFSNMGDTSYETEFSPPVVDLLLVSRGSGD